MDLRRGRRAGTRADRRRSTMDATFLHPPRLGRLEALRPLRRRRALARGPAPPGDRGVGLGRRQRHRGAVHARRRGLEPGDDRASHATSSLAEIEERRGALSHERVTFGRVESNGPVVRLEWEASGSTPDPCRCPAPARCSNRPGCGSGSGRSPGPGSRVGASPRGGVTGRTSPWRHEVLGQPFAPGIQSDTMEPWTLP